MEKPTMTGECNACKNRVSYARILVEIDVTQKRRDVIIIEEAGERKLIQKVKYERLPQFCEKCQKLGHKCKEVPQPLEQNKVQTIWMTRN